MSDAEVIAAERAEKSAAVKAPADETGHRTSSASRHTFWSFVRDFLRISRSSTILLVIFVVLGVVYMWARNDPVLTVEPDRPSPTVVDNAPTTSDEPQPTATGVQPTQPPDPMPTPTDTPTTDIPELPSLDAPPGLDASPGVVAPPGEAPPATPTTTGQPPAPGTP